MRIFVLIYRLYVRLCKYCKYLTCFNAKLSFGGVCRLFSHSVRVTGRVYVGIDFLDVNVVYSMIKVNIKSLEYGIN